MSCGTSRVRLLSRSRFNPQSGWQDICVLRTSCQAVLGHYFQITQCACTSQKKQQKTKKQRRVFSIDFPFNPPSKRGRPCFAQNKGRQKQFRGEWGTAPRGRFTRVTLGSATAVMRWWTPLGQRGVHFGIPKDSGELAYPPPD